MEESIHGFFSLEGKVALVTGGSSGIGVGLARGLAGAGANIALAARREDKTAAVAKSIERDFGVSVLGVKADMLSADDIEAMVKRTEEKFGRLDIFVANAGMAVHKMPEEMSIDEWDTNVDINLKSVFIGAKAVYPIMKKQGGGKIITNGSMTAIFGVGALPAYGASKGGIVQLTKSLAVGWAKDNIQVNCIMPGWINTEMSAEGKRDIPGLEEGIKMRTPAGRWGDPIDLAAAAVFLAGPGSDFVTGVAIPVDGGYAVMGQVKGIENRTMEVKVTVKYSYYRKYLDDREDPSVTLNEGATLNDLVEQLGIARYYLREVIVNGEVKEMDTVLSDGDAVVIWPPRIGGG